MKKNVLLLLALIAMGTAKETKAQSCDARYPMGEWQTVMDDEGQATKYFVSLSVDREKGVCGGLTITENETDKEIFSGSLTYVGKAIENDMPTGTYFFNVTTEQGKTCGITINGSRKPVIIGTGELRNHPAFQEDIVHIPSLLGGTGGETFAQYCETEKELLDQLQMYLKDRRVPVIGFGNVQQYINAHARLDSSKPKYLKPKGTGAVNIREEASTNAAKVGELKPGQTLLVTDEFDGWCQVRINEKKYGWVSLSVVTLTNTPSATVANVATLPDNTTTVPAAETTCPLVGDWYGTLGNGWGETTVYLQADKKTGVNPKMAKRLSNGSINMTDEEFVREWNYNLVFDRTVSENTYEFTVQRMVGKQLKSGKLQIKRNSDSITMTGLDAWTKQQPFHGKTLGKSNPVYQ